MSGFNNWIDDITIGLNSNGYCVRVDGCDVFQNVKGSGGVQYKTRITFSIGEGFSSKKEAIEAAKAWVKKQLKLVLEIELKDSLNEID